MSKVITGFVDGLFGKSIIGWGFDPRQPDERLNIELLIDGKPACQTVASIERGDVAEAGYKKSDCGFDLPIPRHFFDGTPRLLAVRVRGSKDCIPFVLEHGYSDEVQFSLNQNLTVTHSYDGFWEGAFRGWLFGHEGGTTKQLMVQVAVDDQPFTVISTTLARPDVASAHNSPLNVGWEFRPPRVLRDGRPHSYRFQCVESGEDLCKAVVKKLQSADDFATIHQLATTVSDIQTNVWHVAQQIDELRRQLEWDLEEYSYWYQRYRVQLQMRAERLRALEITGPTVKFSLVCPVFHPDPDLFARMLESVRAQTYENWELICVLDGPHGDDEEALLRSACGVDARILLHNSEHAGGISIATNTAISLATGEYVGFLDHDDQLDVHALLFYAHEITQHSTELLYCDEDKITPEGSHFGVHLKPDINRRLLLAQNYICHFLVVSRALLDSCGGLRKKFDGAQDHELLLRLVDRIDDEKIRHVPEILYHWMAVPTSTASGVEAKPYARIAGVAAIQDYLNRKGARGRCESLGDLTAYKIIWDVPVSAPRVTIIIAFRNQAKMTKVCLNSLLSLTEYQNYNVLLVDNFSEKEATTELSLFVHGHQDRVRMVRVPRAFNYSELNNHAAALSDGELIVFMNNDIEISDKSWLTQMVGELLASDQNGVVGARLLYPSGLLQHAGVVLGVGGVANHAFLGLHVDDTAYFCRPLLTQSYSAVTAACMLTRRATFVQLGGFDEVAFPIAYNDVDFCLKARSAGLQVIYSADAILVHHESQSRGRDTSGEKLSRFIVDNAKMLDRWGSVIAEDPYYSQHLNRHGVPFAGLKSI